MQRNQDSRDASSERPPTSLVTLFLLGAAAALAGGFWDDAWHTERGRDSFFIAPHLAIYGGITAAGAALSAWTLLALRRNGLRTLRAQPALLLALLSIGLTLSSAPIDNAWHVAFGRDAVIWSPPHILGIVGAMGLAFSVLCALRAAGVAASDWRCVLAAGLVVAAASFAVVEYETDVPQFSVRWYLPVLAAASALAFALVRRAADTPWAATRASLAHLLFAAAVCGLLSALGFATPLLPLLVLPALAFDAGVRFNLPPVLRGVLHGVAVVSVYAPIRAWQDEGLHLSAADLLSGAVLAAAAAAAILAVIDGRPLRRLPLRPLAAGLIAVIVLLPALKAPQALAHDPGQGKDAGSVDLQVAGNGLRVTVTGRFADSCGELADGQVVLRRAGRTVTAPAVRHGCTLSGTAVVSGGGRWFAYLTATRPGTRVESWLPITLDPDVSTRVRRRDRFAYVPNRHAGGTVKLLGGIALYALAGALLLAMVRLSAPRGGGRRAGRGSAANA